MAVARPALVALVLILASQVAAAFTHEITEAELQQKISAAMPLEIKKQQYTLLISDPVIDLSSADGEITVLAQIELVMPSRQATGNIAFKGKLAYEPDTFSFFLKNVLMKQIQLDGVPESYLPSVKLLAQVAASRIFATHPVYVIKDDSMKASYAKAFLKAVFIKDDKLILSMGLF